ncbi:MAG: P-II family nitrogen regulator [Vicinamibacterales bacterium]
MEALHELPGLPGVTVSRVHAYGGVRQRDAHLRTESAETDFTKLEIIVSADLVADVVDAIKRASHTGRAGDGVVYVVPVEQFARIREVVEPH